MNHQVTSLTAAFKNVDAFGIANAAEIKFNQHWEKI